VHNPASDRASGAGKSACAHHLLDASPAPSSPKKSTQLGWANSFGSHFSVGRVLGQGSFGVVHEATCNATGDRYAVKVLPKSGMAGSPERLEAIRREVSTLSKAQASKYVVRLLGVYEVRIKQLCHVCWLRRLLLGPQLTGVCDACRMRSTLTLCRSCVMVVT
jgi:serine/threonine protein kinase